MQCDWIQEQPEIQEYILRFPDKPAFEYTSEGNSGNYL